MRFGRLGVARVAVLLGQRVDEGVDTSLAGALLEVVRLLEGSCHVMSCDVMGRSTVLSGHRTRGMRCLR